MKLDPGIHIDMHSVLSLKRGVTIEEEEEQYCHTSWVHPLSLSQSIYLFTRREPSGPQVNSATSVRRLEGWAWRLFWADPIEEEGRKLHFDSRQLKRSRGWCLQYWKADSWHSSTLLQSLILCKFTYGLYRTVGVALRWSHTLNL